MEKDYQLPPELEALAKKRNDLIQQADLEGFKNLLPQIIILAQFALKMIDGEIPGRREAYPQNRQNPEKIRAALTSLAAGDLSSIIAFHNHYHGVYLSLFIPQPILDQFPAEPYRLYYHAYVDLLSSLLAAGYKAEKRKALAAQLPPDKKITRQEAYQAESVYLFYFEDQSYHTEARAVGNYVQLPDNRIVLVNDGGVTKGSSTTYHAKLADRHRPENNPIQAKLIVVKGE